MDKVIEGINWLKNGVDKRAEKLAKLKKRIDKLLAIIETLKNKGLSESEISNLLNYLDSNKYIDKSDKEIDDLIKDLESYVEMLKNKYITSHTKTIKNVRH